ncbi:CDK5 and ABL1 enzyme substrate 2 [Cricetulus griseus]|uniref:CDK5 and ABL1 enzyme substrate 2 n=1 Tax=Cricetulus griseus TaxID=10029 RepID=G3HGW8_CRIGR|nr:CDK5 and ABL1 enzyme substrate 2 [Cricetulus griseus]ERE70668.1 Cyclin containing protein [Cricetulus griseus]
MDSFMESLNRLKDAHEREVLGLQNKLLVLNSERYRDAQRVEELFAKNHQLREQQKALKENLRVLENRLRAGLCDRCTVTQELARKKQLELESAHLQSLQHLCVLTNEMNGLREENQTLKEEVKRLRSLGDRAAPQACEGTSETSSPMPLPSPGNWKGATENHPGGPEEAEEEQPGPDKVPSHKASPVARISPAANLSEPRALDMSPQRISNQLHSTVAVVRPGSRACPPDCGTANGTPPAPSNRSSAPSPTYEQSLPVDSFLRACRPSAIAYETLKRSLQTDRLCLLNRHLSLHLQSPHSSPLAPAVAANNPLPQGPKTREAEAWEEPGTFVGIQDPRLEGALHLLLVQQQLRARARAGSARLRVPSAQEDEPTSPPAGSGFENLRLIAPILPAMAAHRLELKSLKNTLLPRRRVTSQRCSLEFLEDAVGCASVQRTKHASGSPRHKGLKKTHFIKNMRQYDTKNSRIVLICAKRSLCAAFSVLPYGEGLRISDLRVDSQKQRHPSGGVSVSSEMVFELEGVELGADGKARALWPASGQQRNDGGEAVEYNPNLLDDPQWPCGKHKRVLIFASYMTTVIEYVKPADLKKDMNETFREKFPHIKLTLSKIRSLKREMRTLSEECSLEPVTVSMAYVYFEKLVLQGKLNKHNRKLCAGACVLLAAKISSDLRKGEVKQLIDKLEERFRFNRRDLIGFEFTVLVALELALYLPESQVLPHYRRLTQQF